MSIYKLCVLFVSVALSVGAVERQANLSYSQQTIRLLPELEVYPQEPVERIIFVHIPKTAGTNVDNIAKAVGTMTGAFHYQRLAVPRTPGCSPVQITEGWIGGWQQLVLNPHLLDTLPESFFLTGHFPYGLHQHLGCSAKYVTLIRHPLERELSTANFAYQRGYVRAEDFIPYLVDQMVDNPQVRLIAGMEAMMGPCTEETLQIAMRHIERDFVLAAPSEEVDTFLQLLASFQKWGALAYAPMQITHEKVVQTLDPLLADALLQKHRWDVRLYEWIKHRWEVYKQAVIVGQKPYDVEQKVLTLMPDHLSSRQPQWLAIGEIEAHNRTYSAQDVVELIQSGFASPNSR